MGRGGTKFEGEAIGVRAGRKKGGPSFKDMRKDMEAFQKTGRHPAVQGSGEHVLPTLPVRDPNRPHVFLSFRAGKTDLGRVLVEIFEPELPLTSRLFLNRCNPGAENTFRGTKVHRVVENYALYGGHSKGHKAAQQRRNTFLRHVQPGLVSLSFSGDEFVFSFERALTLDDTHQVIGRVHGEDSMKTLQRLNTTAVGASDEPLTAIQVADCGQTDSQGNYDPLLGSSSRRETPEESAARLKREEAEARNAVGAALEQGLAQKRGAGGPGKGHPAAKRKRVLPSDSEGSQEEEDSSGSD